MAGESNSDLAARLAALEDQAAILATLSRYAHAIDYGLIESWVNCFTEDGVFDVFDAAGERVHREQGRAELAAYLSTKQFPPQRYVHHVFSVPLVEVRGDTAQVASYFMVLARDGNKAQVKVFGRYQDKLTRRGKEWLLAERVAHIEGGS